MSLAYIQEVMKYIYIEFINVIGSLNDNILNQVINKIPELNSCCSFIVIYKCCMDNTATITLLDDDVND